MDSTQQATEAVLIKSDSESLSAVFRSMSQCADQEADAFRPALSALQAIATKFHEAGLTEIGVTHAGLDDLRRHGFMRRGTSADEPNVVYSILVVQDAEFLLRVHPAGIVDCFNENINVPQAEIRFLDNPSFWMKQEDGKTVPNFFQYDLKQEDDRISFMQAVLDTAVALEKSITYREYDLPAQHGPRLTRTAAAKLK